ncbi:MAG: gluconokinase [Anaerolineaceae bacterium]|nr:gluconokinase [Anaerolineaceae bacterium]
MGHERVILAVDVGTSGVRAVLFDADAHYLQHVRTPYPMLFPRPGWNEQDPNTIASAVIETLKQAIQHIPAGITLAGVTFSAQMYSILALDEGGTPLCNSLTWGDTRSDDQIAALQGAASADLVQRTGCPTQAIYPLAKIRWLKTQLELPQRVKFVSIKDYVLYRLTGRLLADWSTASASGLLDITRFKWDSEALALGGITPDHLPELVSTRHILHDWLPEISATTGIPPGTPLIVGAGDAPLANIGVGATAEGTLAVNIGTSAAARFFTPVPQVDGQGRLWTYVADTGGWVVGGIIGSGGATYEWILKQMLRGGQHRSTEQLFREADQQAAAAPPGAGDLLFIPYFSGEQSPGWNARSTGAFYGMTFHHETQHYLRAAVEGILFAILRVSKTIEELRNRALHRIYLTGGFTTSQVWPQALADMAGVPVVVPSTAESSSRGAAIMGWIALGQADSYAAFAPPEDHLIQPNGDTHALYQRRYAAFCSLNQQLQNFANSSGDVS